MENVAAPRICVALRTALAESPLSQQGLADLVGVTQQTVSNWTRQTQPTLDELESIEEALELESGFLLRTAGYVKEPATTRAAIAGATEISRPDREILLAVYDAAVAKRAADSKATRAASKARS